jgi:hypothetical protein
MSKKTMPAGGGHFSLNSTGSCSFEPNSTKATGCQVSYIVALRMTILGFKF